jgi:hypothetical protein
VTDNTWPLVSIGIGIVVVIIGMAYLLFRLRDRASGFPAEDERTERITGIAARYALHIGLYFMLAVMFALIIGRELFGMPDPGAGPVVVVSILVFSVTYLVLHWRLNRREDRA